MVNENHSVGSPRVPYESESWLSSLKVNEAARNLKVGDAVKLNFRNARKFQDHPAGTIVAITINYRANKIATVQWPDGQEKIPLLNLRRA